MGPALLDRIDARVNRKTHMMKTILATVAAAVAMFSLAGLFTGVLARSFIEANVDKALMRTPPNLVLVFFGYLVWPC